MVGVQNIAGAIQKLRILIADRTEDRGGILVSVNVNNEKRDADCSAVTLKYL